MSCRQSLRTSSNGSSAESNWIVKCCKGVGRESGMRGVRFPTVVSLFLFLCQSSIAAVQHSRISGKLSPICVYVLCRLTSR